jgi:hypothetical protein
MRPGSNVKSKLVRVLNHNNTRRVAKMLAVLILAVCSASAPFGQVGVSPNTTATPILVELFTSEGCSSCPAADTLLERMDTSQPIPGAQLIVLSEHVDYWNHDGWKDPYSSSLLTDRQSAYVRALGLNSPYTPQIIIDGASELRGGGPKVSEILQRAAAVPKLAVRLDSVSVDANTPTVLKARIEVRGDSAKHNADIFAVIALDHAESQVLHGENGGRHLTHVAVVQELTKVGRLEKGKSFNQEVQLKLKTGTDPKNIRFIAFVQESGLGHVLGATMQRAAD